MSTRQCWPRHATSMGCAAWLSAAPPAATRESTRVTASLASISFNGDKTNTRQVRSILPPAEMSSEVHCF